jgi:hypothetical protein
MGQAIAVRTDHKAGEVRGLAKGSKDVAQARRLLAIAAVLEGASREEVAKIGEMDRLRRHRRSLLLRLEHTDREALENHVHRPP